MWSSVNEFKKTTSSTKKIKYFFLPSIKESEASDLKKKKSRNNFTQ